MYLLLRADQRQKQNHKDDILPAHPQELYLLGKEFVPMLNQENIQSAILYFRALQGHSGRNLIDPSSQDNVLIPDNFFKYIYHVGSAINLHSIIYSGLIPGGQNVSNRQTVFFLLVHPMD